MANLNSKKIAVVGATGNVGRSLLSILAERGMPSEQVTAVASDRSEGKLIPYGESGVSLPVHALSSFDFSGYDMGLFSPGGKISAQYAPIAASQGCWVIDNTSYFRTDPEIPLVVPEINPEAISLTAHRRIISNPNCSILQTVMALKPLHDISPIRRVIVSTYQSVSGGGYKAMEALNGETKASLAKAPSPAPHFPRSIAFNAIPQIGPFLEDGYTDEEVKMRQEIKKIIDPRIELSATCVRIPVFVGHCVSATVTFERPVSVEEAHQALKAFPGVHLCATAENLNEYATPIECAGKDPVYVSRVRQDPTCSHSLTLWIVADNVRKGAALNTVQIAECLAAKMGA